MVIGDILNYVKECCVIICHAVQTHANNNFVFIHNRATNKDLNANKTIKLKKLRYCLKMIIVIIKSRSQARRAILRSDAYDLVK